MAASSPVEQEKEKPGEPDSEQVEKAGVAVAAPTQTVVARVGPFSVPDTLEPEHVMVTIGVPASWTTSRDAPAEVLLNASDPFECHSAALAGEVESAPSITSATSKGSFGNFAMECPFGVS